MHRRGVRLGLIGAGLWGRNYIKTIYDLGGVCLTHLASRNPQASEWVDKNCQITADWKSIVREGNVDGVIVATPPLSHVEITRAALSEGLPVLVEKPLTMNLEEAKELFNFAEKKAGIVLVDHTQLFNPAWQSLKQYALEMGPILKIESVAGGWGPFRQGTPVLWDWGPHDLALCLDLFQKLPETIDARWIERRDIDQCKGETIELRMDFGNDLHAQVTLGNLFPEKKRSFTVFFEKGLLVFDDLIPEKLKRHFNNRNSNNEQKEVLPFSNERPLHRVVRAFAERIKKHQSHLEDLRLAVQITALLNDAQDRLSR